jgi:hypothetical protein
MTSVYLSGLVLLVVAYASQTFVRSQATPEMLFSFGLYLLLINWSVVAESVVFATVSRIRPVNGKKLKKLAWFLVDVMHDQVVISCILIITFTYFFYQKNNGMTAAIMIAAVAATFFLRIAESSAKSRAARLGQHKQQQLITSLCASLKWLAIILAVSIQSELAIYASGSLLSLLSISLLIKYFNKRCSVSKQKNLDSPLQRWVMLVATIIGVISYQLDKMIALQYLENSAAGVYILNYSLVFILIQVLAPIYNKYASDGWVSINSEHKDSSYKKNFIKSFMLIVYAGAALNFLLIVMVSLYFAGSFNDKKELIDLALLTIAVFLCAINHIYYYDFIVRKRYQYVLYQNILGLFFGLLAGIVIIFIDLRISMAAIPVFVTLGQSFYVLIISLRLESMICIKTLFDARLGNIVEISIYLFFLTIIGLTSIYSYLMLNEYIYIFIAPLLILLTSIYLMMQTFGGAFFRTLKMVFLH